MSLDSNDYDFNPLEKEVITGELKMTPEEVLEMSEPEYRHQLLARKKPLTEPVIKSVESSMSRERNKLEDFFYSESGAQKWSDIWNSIGPRWAEVLGEYSQRQQQIPQVVAPMEDMYRNALQQRFSVVDENSAWLHSDRPHQSDIQTFTNAYRALERTYAEEIEGNIGPEDLEP